MQDDRAQQQRVACDREKVCEVERKAARVARDHEGVGTPCDHASTEIRFPSAPPHAIPAPTAAAFDGTRGTRTTRAAITTPIITATNDVRA